MIRSTLATLALASAITTAHAYDNQSLASDAAWVGEQADRISAQATGLADDLWNWAEMGYQETRSSAALQDHLKEAGFSIEAGIADIPTAFVARYRQGLGGPVIGLLAEMDALPGVAQQAAPQLSPIQGQAAGHACGHHLFGAGSTAAAIMLSRWLKESGTPGEIRLYGTPAEEGGSGKVYMVRAGAFDGTDVVLQWHPDDQNSALPRSSLANKSAKFRFKGIASHAAAAPERGRSALDGVEAMNFMVNMLREHVPDSTRIHYVITDGGMAPNVVPANAEVFYYVRDVSAAALEPIWERVEQVARAAAQGTGTSVEWEVIHGNHSLLPNQTLNRLLDASMRQFGGIEYSAAEQKFAQTLTGLAHRPEHQLGDEKKIVAYDPSEAASPGSTDVGDVSWNVPTGGFGTATWVPGTSAHTWQAVAAGGMGIGHKGMLLAAETLTLAGIQLLREPQLVEQATSEFQQKRGDDFDYAPLLGDRKPPLDYRK
ncbi:aminobenzoyl-glutamate utilization protein B [Microbulbifer donghaiensis]|uniref:Aminobenzoyl-glutamate utilization protein B n=1 Tax=Microbulbifer donghaiensis TaxID=494016 RepID=A0A1M4XGX1_9GAMM|nr:amidohydrolase [Microbulbifer donghaiensis]SHE92668.1 aminobenzoyl-glutamate utilization protein B [Microbulbifer donghaiensis]